MSDLKLALSDTHNIEELAASYAENGFVRINNLFPDNIAESIHQNLANQTPWHIVHADKEGSHLYYRPEDWAGLADDERQTILRNIMVQASEGFSYFYACYPMIQNYLEQRDPDWPLHAMTEYLNSPEFHNFVKTITNEPSVRKIDGQATLYASGHFLNLHDDMGTEAERRVAYVMGFTKNWTPNWGGQLLMLDENDDSQCGFTPTFNSLTLFKVPRKHIVTQVASFARGGRYSITGWLRDD